jgi:putative FmdB family regulatory protein
VPIYEYEHVEKENLTCEDPIEVIQSMSEEPLTACPECGKPVRRIISKASFAIGINMSPEATAKQGFTTYRKTGHGTYEKAGGEGPDTLNAGDD